MEEKSSLAFDVVIYGSQGSGKTTQAELIAQKFGMRFFGTGAEMRRLAAGDTELQEQLNTGHLLPDKFFVETVTKFIDDGAESERIIFEGAARNPAQQQLFAEILAKRKRPFKIIFIEVSEEEARRRLELRYKNQEQERADEGRAALERRIQIFREQTVPALQAWEKAGHAVLRIDGEVTRAEVTARIEEVLR